MNSGFRVWGSELKNPKPDTQNSKLITMIKHYFKVAIRNLARRKVLALINVLGLSIGLACFTLFLLYAVHEFSYDRVHKNANNIYRVYDWWNFT